MSGVLEFGIYIFAVLGKTKVKPDNFYIHSHYSIDWHRDNSQEGREVSSVTASPMPTQFNHSFGTTEWHGHQQRCMVGNST